MLRWVCALSIRRYVCCASSQRQLVFGVRAQHHYTECLPRFICTGSTLADKKQIAAEQKMQKIDNSTRGVFCSNFQICCSGAVHIVTSHECIPAVPSVSSLFIYQVWRNYPNLISGIFPWRKVLVGNTYSFASYVARVSVHKLRSICTVLRNVTSKASSQSRHVWNMMLSQQ